MQWDNLSRFQTLNLVSNYIKTEKETGSLLVAVLVSMTTQIFLTRGFKKKLVLSANQTNRNFCARHHITWWWETIWINSQANNVKRDTYFRQCCRIRGVETNFFPWNQIQRELPIPDPVVTPKFLGPHNGAGEIFSFALFTIAADIFVLFNILLFLDSLERSTKRSKVKVHCHSVLLKSKSLALSALWSSASTT